MCASLDLICFFYINPAKHKGSPSIVDAQSKHHLSWAQRHTLTSGAELAHAMSLQGGQLLGALGIPGPNVSLANVWWQLLAAAEPERPL